MSMDHAARKAADHHRKAMPDARPQPAFPPAVMWGVLASAVIGALAGASIAEMTRAGSILALPRMEQLQSMGVVTFFIFWTVAGTALGIAVGGTASLLLGQPASASPAADEHQ